MNNSIIYKCGIFFTVLAFVILPQVDCQSQDDEIPISTYSNEARKIFRQARDKYEFKRVAEADAQLTEALNKDPLFPQAHIYKALTSSASEDIDKAIEMATANASRATEAEQLFIAALKAFQWEKNPEKAIQLYQQVIDIYPKDARPRWLLGRVYTSIKNSAKSIDQMKKAVAINNEFVPAFKDLGYRHMFIEDYEKAEEFFLRSLELAPDEPNSHDSLADLYTRTGRFEEAITHYKKALELDPSFALSERNIGLNLCFLGKYKEGREVLRKAVEKETNPTDKVLTMTKIIHSYLYEQDFIKALEATDETVQEAIASGVLEEAVNYHLAKCIIYCELKDCENAQKSIEDCREMFQKVNLAPYDKKYFEGECLRWEAWIAADRGEFDKALKKASEYRANLEARNDHSRFMYHTALLGYIALQQEKNDWAYELFKNADINDPFYIYYTAVAKDKTGDLISAAKYFRKAGNWNYDSLQYALVRHKALTRKR
ncbi:tetratricopeptide repeat protein [Acidobacteriota bacterium]